MNNIKTNIFECILMQKRSNYEIQENINKLKEINEQLKQELKEWNSKAEKIKKQITFNVPDYIIDEIISQEYYKNKNNLYCLINLAKMNGRISEKAMIELKTYINNIL